MTKRCIFNKKHVHFIAECPKLPYLCIVFFIVLDLRLTRLGYSGIPFFCAYTDVRGEKEDEEETRRKVHATACDNGVRFTQRTPAHGFLPFWKTACPPQKKNSLSRGAHHAPQEREFFSSGFRALRLGRPETTVETKGEADEDEEDAAIGHSGSGGD